MNRSLTGWPLILAFVGIWTAPMLLACGAAYHQQPRSTDSESPTSRFQQILHPGPLATQEEGSLARMAWYCFCCERNTRQQMLYPGESLQQQPCDTITLACDESLSISHRYELLRILSRRFLSHGLNNDPVATQVLGGD